MTPTEWEPASRAFVAGAFGIVLRSLVLAAFCGCAAWLLRSKTAELRFLLWRWTLFALLALPLLIRVTPPLLKAPRAQAAVTVLPSTPAAHSGNHPLDTRSFSHRKLSSYSPAWILFLPGLYVFVTLVLLARLGYNLSCLGRIAQRSQFIPDAAFRELFHEIWLESGARLKPRIAASNDVITPVTFDSGDIWILLPQSWRTWDKAKLRAVLTHEMAHVKRGDSATLLLASITTCLFWFHPLSWFLRRQLSALAEEACDEVVVASGAAPEQYANLLIDFAHDVKRQHGRIVAEATAVAGRSSLKKRIERLFADTPYKQRGKKALASLAFVLFVPAVYLTAAARFGEPETQESSHIPWPRWQQIVSLSPADATALEAAVEANPEDLDARMEWLVYCAWKGQDLPFTSQLLWFIKQHPSTESLQMAEGMFRPIKSLSDTSREQIQAAWEEAIVKHSNSPVVLFNAASSLQRTEPERGLELLRQAEALDVPAKQLMYEHSVAAIYAAAELQRLRPGGEINNIQMSDDSSARLREQMKESADPALLAEVGRILVQLNTPRGGEEQFHLGLELIQQAIQLDPNNKQWTEALQSAEAEPQRQLNYERLAHSEPLQRGTVRIGSQVAESSLVSKIDPIYPPFALAAHIQGTVEFTVTVRPDGKISAIQLIRGPSLLVNAAKDAVSKWIYHPATIDGKAVPFVTQVIVPFRLAQ
jgi:beta-lactamase regulating signal transducer with metallopeptidase domain